MEGGARPGTGGMRAAVRGVCEGSGTSLTGKTAGARRSARCLGKRPRTFGLVSGAAETSDFSSPENASATELSSWPWTASPESSRWPVPRVVRTARSRSRGAPVRTVDIPHAVTMARQTATNDVEKARRRMLRHDGCRDDDVVGTRIARIRQPAVAFKAPSADGDRRTSKKARGDEPSSPCFVEESRQRPTLPRTYARSTIGGNRLNFRVRNGNGCDPAPMTTGKLIVWGPICARVSELRRAGPREARPSSAWRGA